MKDPITLNLRCPRCRGKLQKSGKRHFYNVYELREVQAFKCPSCGLQTTKPVDISVEDGEK